MLSVVFLYNQNKLMKYKFIKVVHNWIFVKYEYYFGLHSCIPVCCVRQYVKEQCFDKSNHTFHHRIMSHGLDIHEYNGPSYVLCDDCMKSYLTYNIVKTKTIHRCNSSLSCRFYNLIRKIFIKSIYDAQYEQSLKEM